MAYRILLADDSLTIQKVVELTFTDPDTKLMAVGNGDRAVQALDEFEPDLVLADVVMPGLNGYDVCETVKGRPGGALIPVVLLTGTFEPFDRARAERVGSDAIVTKPFDSHALSSLVRELIRKAHAAREAALAAPPAPPPPPPVPAEEPLLGLAFDEETPAPTVILHVTPPPPLPPPPPPLPVEPYEPFEAAPAGEEALPVEPAFVEPPPAPALFEEAASGEPAFEEPLKAEPAFPEPALPPPVSGSRWAVPPPLPPEPFLEVTPTEPIDVYETVRLKIPTAEELAALVAARAPRVEPAEVPPAPPRLVPPPLPPLVPVHEVEPAVAQPLAPPEPFAEELPGVPEEPLEIPVAAQVEEEPVPFGEPVPFEAATPTELETPEPIAPAEEAAPPVEVPESPFGEEPPPEPFAVETELPELPEVPMEAAVAAPLEELVGEPERAPTTLADLEAEATVAAAEPAGVAAVEEPAAFPEPSEAAVAAEVEAAEAPAFDVEVGEVVAEPAFPPEPPSAQASREEGGGPLDVEPSPEEPVPAFAVEAPEGGIVPAEAVVPFVEEEGAEPFPEMALPAPPVLEAPVDEAVPPLELEAETELSPWEAGAPPPPPDLAALPEEGPEGEVIRRDIEADIEAFERSGKVKRRPEIWERHAALIGETAPPDIDEAQSAPGLPAPFDEAEPIPVPPGDLEELAAQTDLSALIPVGAVSSAAAAAAAAPVLLPVPEPLPPEVPEVTAEAPPVAVAPPPPLVPAALTEADVDRIARRVVELLGDRTVREIAWEVVPEVARRLVRERIAEVERSS